MKGALLKSFVAVFCVAASAHADPYALSADGSAVVRLVPQGSVAASSFNSSLLTGGYTSTTGTGGSLSVTSYTAGFSGGIGGAQIRALYDRGSTLSTGQSLEWVQVINTNVPLGGAMSPYLDNAGKPAEPYYTYTQANRDLSLPVNQLNFYDYSKRDPATLSTVNPITWNANLYPVIRDASKAFTVEDGVSWGWTMKKAMVGTDSAIFVNPSPSTAVVSGVGTNNFSWGTGNPDMSSLTFTGGSFDTSPLTPFKLGRLTFHNGTIVDGTGADNVDFNVSLSFDNVPEKNFVFSTPFTLINTPNTADPIASADIVSIGNFGFTFNVLEGATASVDIYAELSTGLMATASGAIPSGAELASFALPFDPNPDYILTLVALLEPSSGGFVGSMPEPSPLTIMIPASLVIWWWSRSRRRAYSRLA